MFPAIPPKVCEGLGSVAEWGALLTFVSFWILCQSSDHLWALVLDQHSGHTHCEQLLSMAQEHMGTYN
jgi:hypothetical protein